MDLDTTLLAGDVLLTGGNTRIAALVKRITKSTWSHVALYVGPLEDGPDPRCIVEADVLAGVRAIRLSEVKDLQMRVLRPALLNEQQRRRITDWVVSRIGARYDLALALRLAAGFLGLRLRPRGSAKRFICSTLLAQAFLLVGQTIASERHATPRDFETAASFEVVL